MTYYREKVRCYKRSHSQTVYRNFGDDQSVETSDDFLTFCIFDAFGRTINNYTTDYTERNVISAGSATYKTNSGTNKTNNRLLASASGGIKTPNLLYNSNVEKGSSTTTATDWSRSGSYATRTTAKPYYGDYAFQFSRSAATSTADYWSQQVSLTSGKTYTFSAYVNIPTATEFSTNGGLRLKIAGQASEDLDSATQSMNNGWRRITLTVEAQTTGNTTIAVEASNYTGNIYVDALQLEQADAPSTYNLIEDSSFEKGTISSPS